MKKDPRAIAKEIVDDYYNLFNQTYGAGYRTAKAHGLDMIEHRLATENLKPNEYQHWFEVKLEMQQL